MLGVISGLAHLGPGFLMLVSGLLAPLWAVVGMLLGWALLAWLLVTLVRRRSWWTPAVPVGALLLWVTVITLGENLLGWTG